MAVEHYFSQERKSIPSAMTETEDSNSCFDCNICLDFADEPVVTLCGHLYCWPCIYKWLHIQSASLAADEHPQCPVCKAGISHTAMVPLYGRGQGSAQSQHGSKASYRDVFVPPRPPASGAQDLMGTSSQTFQQLPYRSPYQSQDDSPPLVNTSSEMRNVGATMTPEFNHPVVGMFGEMVYSSVFGNPENLYAYPNSYHPIGSNSNRLRRQEKSLNRISIFLFCCFLLCLIVF